MLISAYTYRIVRSQFISINLERVDILMSIFLTHTLKRNTQKNIYAYICILPKTKNFDCAGRGDLTSVFFSEVAK